MSMRAKIAGIIWAVILLIVTAVIIVVRGNHDAAGQQTGAQISFNGSSNQSALYQSVNGFVPIVNGFPVIVGEVYHTGLTGSSFNNVLYSAAQNPYTNATYKVVCTLAATATTAGVVSLSLSYTDAATQSATSFNLTMGTVTLSTTTPTLINAVNIAASNLTSITYTTVLVSGTATYNVDCYLEAENHH
jgi:hypothetical protein